MNTDFQYDALSRSRISIAGIRADTRTRYTEQSRILAFFHRYTQDAIHLRAPAIVVIADFIYILILGTTLRQKHLGRIEVILSSLIQCLLPESIKILRFLCERLDLLWRETCRAKTLVILTVYMSDNLQTIEARSVQTAAPFHGSVLEGGTFLHLRKHCRSSFVINLHLIE